jgi:hypothetical protein
LWAKTLNPLGISQGDVLKDVPTGSTKIPLTFLARESYQPKGQPRILYTKYDQLQEYTNEPGIGNFIAKGRVSFALVVTHDCDLDDVDDTERIIVAPVFHISRITSSEADRARVMAGGGFPRSARSLLYEAAAQARHQGLSRTDLRGKQYEARGARHAALISWPCDGPIGARAWRSRGGRGSRVMPGGGAIA